MSLIHEKLYQSKDLARIDFFQYIQSLTGNLFQTYGVDSNLVSLKIEVKDVFLDINKGIPCGLIINELVSNSLKHAFSDGRKGELSIKLQSDKKGIITLTVSDNGIGFPEEIAYRKSKTLGIQIVYLLADQLKGSVELDKKGGTTFKIKF